MPEINAFVGYGFEESDKSAVQPFLDHLETFSLAHPSFHWTSAREPEAKDVGDKVLDKIEGKDVLIAICTRKERVAKPQDIKKIPIFSQSRIHDDKFLWKTSDWIIQEIGVALGRGMTIIPLIEEGVRDPGNLQGNIEKIYFSRNSPSAAFDTLDRMLLSLEPKLTAVAAASSQQPEEKDEGNGKLWEQPQPDWDFHQYEMTALMVIFFGEDVSKKLKVIEDAFKASPHATDKNIIVWNSGIETAKIRFAKDGSFDNLKALVAQYPDNHRLLKDLAIAYAHYQDYASAAKVNEQEADSANDSKAKLSALIRAATNYRKNKDNFSASRIVEKMRNFVNNDETEAQFLRGIVDLFDEKDIERVCAEERLLALNAADTDTRFNIGLAYQNRSNYQAALSLYHYLRIPENQLKSIGWNNLGVAYALNDIGGLAVDAYKKAEAEGETLAMSNLANKLIEAGFLDEARKKCDNARSIPDYDKRIDEAFVRLKEVESNEQVQVKEILLKAAPVSKFYSDAGEALTKPHTSIVGRWQHDKCLVNFTQHDGNKLIGVGTYQTKRDQPTGLLGLFGGGDIKVDIEGRLTYEIAQIGHFFKGESKDVRDDDHRLSTLLTANTPYDIIMFLSPDGLVLEVLEVHYGKQRFYKLKRIELVPSNPVKSLN
jgi:hypothetical protein